MISIVLLIAAQVGPWASYQNKPNPFDQFDPKQQALSAGPHTLVISDGEQMTRMEYKSGALCQRARDAVRRQVASPPNTPTRIYGPSTVKALCVPR